MILIASNSSMFMVLIKLLFSFENFDLARYSFWRKNMNNNSRVAFLLSIQEGGGLLCEDFS